MVDKCPWMEYNTTHTKAEAAGFMSTHRFGNRREGKGMPAEGNAGCRAALPGAAQNMRGTVIRSGWRADLGQWENPALCRPDAGIYFLRKQRDTYEEDILSYPGEGPGD